MSAEVIDCYGCEWECVGLTDIPGFCELRHTEVAYVFGRTWTVAELLEFERKKMEEMK